MIGPFQNFQFVALPIAKDKERRTTGIQVEGTVDQGSQTVNGFPQIGRPYRKYTGRLVPPIIMTTEPGQPLETRADRNRDRPEFLRDRCGRSMWPPGSSPLATATPPKRVVRNS